MSNEVSAEPLYVDERRAAAIIGMSVSWMQRARYEKIGPRWYKVARRVRYAVTDLREWGESGRAATEHVSPPRRKAGGK